MSFLGKLEAAAMDYPRTCQCILLVAWSIVCALIGFLINDARHMPDRLDAIYQRVEIQNLKERLATERYVSSLRQQEIERLQRSD